MNELTLLNTNGQLPDYLRELQYEDSGLGSGIAPRAPKLSVTTAKQWTVTKDGQTMILPAPTVRGVFVASGETITKAWYAQAYKPGTSEAPDCYSNDGKIPAAGCKAPQHSNCAQCPKNAFGSHPVTGRGKACGDRKLTVFVWEGMPGELMTFNVPTMSMQSLRKIDTELRNANIPVQSVMVEMSFDPAVLYPVVKIGAVGFIEKENAVQLIARSRTQEVADLLREVDYDDQPDQTQTAASPVPQQTVSLSQSEPQSFPPADPAPTQSSVLQPNVNATLPSSPPKRTRRTKAEMEAARAAEAAQQQQAAPPLDWSTQQTVAADPAALQAAQQAQSQQVQPAATVPTGGMDVASLLAKWQQ